MHWTAPLPVAIPLLTAALLTGAAPLLSRKWADLLTIAAMTAVAAVCTVLLQAANEAPFVYWDVGLGAARRRCSRHCAGGRPVRGGPRADGSGAHTVPR